MERRAIVVTGLVQGVGFRPFVHGLAVRLGLAGFVKNRTGGVLIEVEGGSAPLDLFLAELADRPPPLAQIESVSWGGLPARGGRGFRIEASEADGASPVFISPDVATCPDCLAELFDPGDRRFGYPFLNCTNCGPRLTIVTGAPYDRARTTMAPFAMCAACRAEYDDPSDRRANRLYLTDKATPTLKELGALGEDLMAMALAGVDSRGVAAMTAHLTRVKANLRAELNNKG